MSDATQQVSEILEAIRDGDSQAEEQLYPLVYAELKGIARSFMVREGPGHTLQPTALVHEAYLRLLGTNAPRWQNRAHFFTAAAESMRRILIDHARRKTSLKRGGDRQRETLDAELLQAGDADLEELLSLDEALTRLEKVDEGMVQVVKLRYFAGLSIDETAKVLGSSGRSVSRQWTAARAWLRRELSLEQSQPEPGK